MEQTDKTKQEASDIEYILSGTGCSNLKEFKIAFDHLRNVLSVKYGENWDQKRIAKTVCDIMYGIKE
jgi:hypothetical protein